MTLTIFTELESSLVNSFGSLLMVSLGIIVFFTIAFIILGTDFRITMLIDTILIIAFSRMGWINTNVEGIFWILIVGFGAYIGLSYITQR